MAVLASAVIAALAYPYTPEDSFEIEMLRRHGPLSDEGRGSGRGHEGPSPRAMEMMRGPPPAFAHHGRRHRHGRRFGPDSEEDETGPFAEPSIKENCEKLATALSKGDHRALVKMMHKHAHLSYANSELPTGGHWVGERGLKAYAERARNTVKDVTAKIRVVSADAGFQRCVLKSNITGTFIRSGGKFRDVTLYNTVDWSLGRVTRMRLIDGGNYDAMMQAYRTRAETNTHNLFRAVYTHGPGAKIDELVSDKAIVLLGRRGYSFNGTTAVSKALTAIKKFAGEFGLSRESLLLPMHATRSKQCRLLFSDEHNHGGECRVHNIKSRTTSFKHLDFVYRIRFDMNGKMDRLSIVESRAFLPGELVRDIKSGDSDDNDASAPAAENATPEFTASGDESSEIEEDGDI